METGLTSSIPCLGERLEFTQLGVNSEQRGQSEPQTGPPKDDMFPGIRLDRKKKKKSEGQASHPCLLLRLRWGPMNRYNRS